MLSQKVEEFLESRRHMFLNPEAYRQARQALLVCNGEEVQAEFENRLQSGVAQRIPFRVLWVASATGGLVRPIPRHPPVGYAD